MQSYFYECTRGTSVIRAFSQEENIIEKQRKLLDQTTISFIAHGSCWRWYSLRVFYTSRLLYIAAILLIAKSRTTVDTITLVLLFRWTTDSGWFMRIIACINQFKCEAQSAQKVFSLQSVPLEKIKGSEVPSKSWPSQGEIEFKSINLRYRPNTLLVLKDVSFKVSPGLKVGVVGRTGAGKSTLCMAITRIVELESGSILIDN